MTSTLFHDAWRLLAQEGSSGNVRLVRLGGVVSGNRYWGSLLEVAGDGTLQATAEPAVEVTNLAEPASEAGRLAQGAEAPAFDVEGRWIVFVPPAADGESFPARVLSFTTPYYTVRRQALNSAGQFMDAPGPVDVEATNLAELSLGLGGMVDAEAIVIVHGLAIGQPQIGARYVFDRPVYAKYME